MARTTSDPGAPGAGRPPGPGRPEQDGRLAQPDLPGRPCSIARALDLIGEKWALLAIREISFGNRRFNEIARNTGAPRDRLAARLRGLVDAGILERREYQAAPPRAEYHLAAAGRDLVPVLRALLTWGDRWVSDQPPATLVHGDHELDLAQVCRHCGQEFPAPVSLQVNSPGWDIHGPIPASDLAGTAAAWDAEYAAGRYAGDPPVEFVRDILAAAAQRGLRHGLYVGCGSGRNLLPLLDAGLDLTGLDLSRRAIAELRARRPDRAGRLITGDLGALPPAARYDLVIGIQVFQHGTRAQAHRHLAAAAARVRPGGLLCVRVNAAGTDIEHAHRRFEEHGDGSFSVRYRSGPKAGLDIHFFVAAELAAAVGGAFDPVLSPRQHVTWRTPPGRGQWAQWEAIWLRR
jgi:DNA-binding HxlR family transcriptional regulator/SAM-dependent methyltransferase